jgi:transcriptional regulator with XRE-family HTH domain
MVLRTYCRYESGEKDVPFSFVIKIADLYGVSLDYLAGRTDGPDFEAR